MKNCKYHIVRIVPQSNRGMQKTQNTTVRIAPKYYREIYLKKSTKFHTVRAIPKYNRKITERYQIVPLTHKYMTAHFLDLVQIGTGTSQKWRG